MLYRDPKGETVGSFAPSIEAAGPNQLSTNQSGTNEEEKATLLKTLKEKENKINELTVEIQTLKVIREREGGRERTREREREREGGQRHRLDVYVHVQGEARQQKEENGIMKHEMNGTNETNESNHTTVL